MSRSVVLTVTALILIGSGCGDGQGGTTSTGTGGDTRGLLLGTIRDASGNPVGEASVRVAGLVTTSNSQGYFSVELDAVDRVVVRFSKTSYVPTSIVTRVQSEEASYLNAVLAPAVDAGTVTAADGGTVSSGGASVTLPADGFVRDDGSAFSGTVHVAVTPFDPTSAAGLAAFPGDFEGVRADDSVVPIESFGFVDVTLTEPNGGALNLAAGTTATLVIPVPAAVLASAPASIPLWYFDEVEGRWFEEGSATLSGGVYVGTVSHFTVWNVDMPRQTSWVRGRVIDGRGPVRGARVTVLGQNWQSGESSTPEDGTFRIPVGSSRTCTLFAAKNGIESDRLIFTSAAVGEEYDVGDVLLGVPVIKIALSWAEEPRDLDAHLTIPGDGGVREHLYYSTDAVGGAVLDTDDTTSFGPEIITVVALHDGVYRYAVHHYAGLETISTSGAIVTMVIDRYGLFTLTPPGGAAGTNDAWLLWDITVAGGQVSSVTPLNRFVNAVSSGDTAAFSP